MIGGVVGPRKAGIVGILLAAGSGSRFGSDKLMHPLPDGEAIAVRSARNLKGVVADCIAVVRPGSVLLASALRAEGFDVTVCQDAAGGMGHSLAEAVRVRPDAAGYLVALADMPFIASASIAAVAEALRGGASVATPSWRGRRGHPVGFAGVHSGALAELTGDAGARHLISGLIKSKPSSIREIEVNDPGILRDVDTLSDLDEP